MPAVHQLQSFEQKTKVPSIAPFRGASLLVLRFLYINGSGYPAQIAKHCGITSARACQVLQDLELKGIAESSTREGECTYCTGTGRKNYGTSVAQCIYCEGSGRLRHKTYPVIYRVSEHSKTAVQSVFNAIYEINMIQKEPAVRTTL